MRKVNIINYKIYFYAFFILLSAFALSGINFDKIIKKNRIIETKLLVLILSFSLGYILTNFVINFLEMSKIFD